jgi:pimeloyl-ACP methyl ester carboxylesterase
MRDLVRRDVARAHDIAAVQNHDILADDGQQRESLSAIAAPTLVVHGTADPAFPIAHGEALAEGIPGARLLQLQKAGHGVEPADWETITHAIHRHTTDARPSSQPCRVSRSTTVCGGAQSKRKGTHPCQQ